MKTAIKIFVGFFVLSIIIVAVAFFFKGKNDSVITFKKTYGGELEESGQYVQKTSDGGYILIGSTHSYGNGDSDVYLVKVDSRGNKLWERTYGRTSREGGKCVKETPDGGFILVGSSRDPGTGTNNMYIAKTDANGISVWEKFLLEKSTAYSVVVTEDGGYCVLVISASSEVMNRGILLLKFDSNGNEIWRKTYDKENTELGLSVIRTKDGGYAIIGRENNTPNNRAMVYLIKTDGNGELQWERSYGGTSDDEGISLRQTSDGGYIIIGRTSSYALKLETRVSGKKDMYLIKTDGEGNELWYKVFYGSATSIVATDDDGYVILGHMDLSKKSSLIDDLKSVNEKNTVTEKSDSDIRIIKVDKNGDEVWSKDFGGESKEESGWIERADDGGFVIIGKIQSSDTGDYDLYFIKTDRNGEISLF